MNNLATFFIVPVMLIVIVVLLRLLQWLSAVQNTGNTLMVGVPNVVPLKNGKSAPVHEAEEGAS